jgi:rod shape-determining protein MreD
MMKNGIWLIAVVGTALVQTTWPDFLKIQEAVPDLTLLLVVFFGIIEGEERAMYTGLIGGIYQDVASNAVLGHHVICLVIVGYLVGRISVRLITEHPAIKVGLAFAAGFLSGTLFTFIQYVQQPDISATYQIVTSVVPSAFYTALLTPLLFLVLGWVFQPRQSYQGGLA